MRREGLTTICTSYNRGVEPKTYAIRSDLRDQGRLLLWLAPIVPAVMAVVAVRQPPTGTNRMFFAALLAVFVALIPFALWVRSLYSATIEVDDSALTYRRGKKVTAIRWSDVRALENHPIAKRLKVFSFSGAVINVDYQFAGFEELTALIATCSGRSIDQLAQRAQPIAEGVIEITPPGWFRYALFVFIPAAAYVMSVRFLVPGFRQQRVGLVILGLFGGWVVARAVRGWWFRLGTSLRLDASGIHFKSRKETTSAPWENISTAELEYPDGNTWFVVRDRSGEPVLALKRELFNWTSTAMKRFDQLVATARQRTVRE